MSTCLLVVTQRIIRLAGGQHRRTAAIQTPGKIARFDTAQAELDQVLAADLHIGTQREQAGAVVVAPVITVGQAAVIALLVGQAKMAHLTQGAPTAHAVILHALIALIGRDRDATHHGRIHRDDVDHPEKGIPAIGDVVAAPNHFDAFDIGNADRDQRPIHPVAKGRGIHGTPIDQHLHPRRIILVAHPVVGHTR